MDRENWEVWKLESSCGKGDWLPGAGVEIRTWELSFQVAV